MIKLFNSIDTNYSSNGDKTYITQINDELPFILDVEAIKKYEVA